MCEKKNQKNTQPSRNCTGKQSHQPGLTLNQPDQIEIEDPSRLSTRPTDRIPENPQKKGRKKPVPLHSVTHSFTYPCPTFPFQMLLLWWWLIPPIYLSISWSSQYLLEPPFLLFLPGPNGPSLFHIQGLNGWSEPKQDEVVTHRAWSHSCVCISMMPAL